MDEKVGKNETLFPGGFIPPNYGSHVRDFRTHESNIDDLYNEKISNFIKIGFETLNNSLVECALILSSEDYANSFIKEREDKKREEEAKRKEEEADKKKKKEDAEKILKVYTEKLKNKIDSMDISDDEKARIFQLLISNEPIQIDTSIISDFSQIVKKSFCDALKEVKPEVSEMIVGDSINFNPMILALIVSPEVTLPPLTFMALTSDNNGKSAVDPMLFMMMMNKDTDHSKLTPFLFMTKRPI